MPRSAESQARSLVGPEPDDAYRLAFRDWLAGAVRGSAEPAARIATQVGGPLAGIAAAGHVLDFDDTWTPGLVHLSAACAPAALAVAAEQDASVGETLVAYADGFEAMAALARAAHPLLYERGMHPTAVTGTVGAAVVASSLLGLDPAERRRAVAFAALRATGLQAAFGSDAKAIQVGMAIAEGVRAARIAAAGAVIDPERVFAGFAESIGAGEQVVAALSQSAPGGAIDQNWVKAYPCCLQTHSVIDAALIARESFPAGGPEPIEVAVHPLSRRAAAYDDVADPLQAKFSIPYLCAFTLLHGPPGVASFEALDAGACDLTGSVTVRTDERLGQSEAVLFIDGAEVARIEEALGSPSRPMSRQQLDDKALTMAGDWVLGALDDFATPAADLLTAAQTASSRATASARSAAQATAG